MKNFCFLNWQENRNIFYNNKEKLNFKYPLKEIRFKKKINKQNNEIAATIVIQYSKNILF